MVSANSASDSPQLSLAAVGQSGSYFDVIVAAGATISLQVALTNPGTAATLAHTYSASVFTIVNGGFGATDGTGPRTGATRWVDYPEAIVPLAAGATDTKSFTVTVPTGTPPGQYLSSIVLQSADSSKGAGQVSLDHVLRQAIAISIRVPGSLKPQFSLGAVGYTRVGGRSVIEVSLSNVGNEHLKPTGTMTVKDANHSIVSEAPVTLGSVYAGMDTTVAVTLNGLLPPGKYTVSLTLTDSSTGAAATITNSSFAVTDSAKGSQSMPNQLPAIIQKVRTQSGVVLLIAVVGIVFWLAVAMSVILLVHRRSRKRL